MDKLNDLANQRIDHEVVIDKYTRIVLSIPKRLDAAELKALFVKANKLFSMSEIELQTKTTGTPAIFHWSQEQRDFLKECIAKDITPRNAMPLFAKRFGIDLPYRKLYPAYYDIKRKQTIIREVRR